MNTLSQKMGTFLISLSSIGLIYIYYPILRLEINYHANADLITTPISTQFGLVIDKLGINETVVPNVDPYNPTVYLPVLKHSIAHAKSSAFPGEKGNVFLFAHSSDNPFSITRYNTSFYLLNKLKKGDVIKLYYQDQIFEYQVHETIIVSPTQIEALASQESSKKLTLQTCYPTGTSLMRLLVIAHQTSPDNLPN